MRKIYITTAERRERRRLFFAIVVLISEAISSQPRGNLAATSKTTVSHSENSRLGQKLDAARRQAHNAPRMLPAIPARVRTAMGLVLLMVWLWPLATPLMDKADSIGYVTPALSVVDDGNLLYLDEFRAMGMNPRYFRVTAAGAIGNHGDIGVSLLHLVPLSMSRMVSPNDDRIDGVGLAAIQAVALLLVAILFLVGTRLVRQACELPTKHAIAVTALTIVGTPVLFYTHVQPQRPHLLEALLATTFVYLVFRQRSAPTVKGMALVGLALAAAFLTRGQSLFLIVFPLWLLAVQWRESERTRSQRLDLLVRLAGLFAPMVFAWIFKARLGALIYGAGTTSLYRGLTDVEFAFFESLFAAHHGLFSWSPLLLIAAVGLFAAAKKNSWIAIPSLLFVATQLYLNGTSFDQVVDQYQYTRHWAGGGSFGGRKYLSCLPLFLIGLGELVRRGSSTQRLAFYGVGTLCAAWTLSLTIAGRFAPYETLERLHTWSSLLELHSITFESLGALVTLSMAPSFGVAFRGWAIAMVIALAVAIGFHLWPRLERLSPLLRRSLLAVPVVLAVTGALTVFTNTRAALNTRAKQIAALGRENAQTAKFVQRNIWLGNARLRAHVDDYDGALERYRLALEVGIGRKSLAEYLALSERIEGPSARDARLEALELLFPNNPRLRESR